MKQEEVKNLKKELGETIRTAREKANRTQLEVAEEARVDVSYYAQIERGEVNPSFEKIISITKVLDIETLSFK